MAVVLSVMDMPVDLLSWQWLTTCMVFVLCCHLARFYNAVSKYPKGPFPLPFVGNAMVLKKERLLFKKVKEWSLSYGDPLTIWMGQKPMVILNSNQVLREGLIEKGHQLAGRIPSKLSDPQRQIPSNVLSEDYNPTLKALRKVTLNLSRKLAVSKSLEDLCCYVVDSSVDALQQGPQLMDSKQLLSQIVEGIFNISGYGARGHISNFSLEEKAQALKKATSTEVISESTPWWGFLHHRQESKMKHLLNSFFQTYSSLYQRAKAAYAPGQLKGFTPATVPPREESSTNDKMDDQRLPDENNVESFIHTFAAGTNPITAELQWLMLRMAKEPSIQTKIQKEIEENIGDAPPTMKDKDNCPYTLACIFETLRFYPGLSMALPHKASQDTEVGGRVIPKGTCILYNIHSVNHDSALWKDPDVFMPERFLDPATGRFTPEKLPPLMTFGAGPRSCPGARLTIGYVFSVVVRLMQRLSVSAPASEADVDTEIAHYNLFPEPAPQNIIFTRRS